MMNCDTIIYILGSWAVLSVAINLFAAFGHWQVKNEQRDALKQIKAKYVPKEDPHG